LAAIPPATSHTLLFAAAYAVLLALKEMVIVDRFEWNKVFIALVSWPWLAHFFSAYPSWSGGAFLSAAALALGGGLLVRSMMSRTTVPQSMVIGVVSAWLIWQVMAAALLLPIDAVRQAAVSYIAILALLEATGLLAGREGWKTMKVRLGFICVLSALILASSAWSI
jgi:hypothetical protein